jgi:hypothetical protein
LLAALFAAALCAGDARADTSVLAGSWSAGPLSETVTIKSWVKECGPQPAGGGLPGGGYTISISGDELVFSGANAFRTDQCVDMTTAKRVAHSANPTSRTWSTRCETPKDDPRSAQISTSVKATTDDQIVLYEKASYSWTWASGTCAADVTRSRTWTSSRSLAAAASSSAAPAVSTAPKPTATATAAPTATSVAGCETPGEAAKLEVRPKRKVMRPGESFEFKARLLDANGCEVAEKAKFSIAPESPASPKGLTVDAAGRVKSTDAAEPVALTLLVDGASQKVKVQLEVVSSDRYQEVLTKEGLDATGADNQAVSVVVSGVGGGGGATVVDPKAAEEGSRKRVALLAIGGGVALLVALGAVVLLRRSKAKEAADVEKQREAREAIEREHARAKAAHDAQVAAAQDALAKGTAKRCPTCSTIFPPDAEFCPLDGARLVQASRAPQPRASQPQPMPPPGSFLPPGAKAAKMCPVCGEKFAREAAFCGKDGVALVPLN